METVAGPFTVAECARMADAVPTGGWKRFIPGYRWERDKIAR